jgi:hypothetical protein
MSLAQREVWDNTKQKIMSNKHIEIIRFDNAKIHIKEYFGERALQPVTYQPAIIKMIGARLLIINPEIRKSIMIADMKIVLLSE